MDGEKDFGCHQKQNNVLFHNQQQPLISYLYAGISKGAQFSLTKHSFPINKAYWIRYAQN